MGNEMGNSNVSELKEEENKTVEAEENSPQEANHADDEQGENQIVPDDEVKDFNGKVEGLSSDIPLGAGDPPVNKQASDGKDFRSTEVLPIETNGAASQDSGIQDASSPKDVNHDLEKATESNLEANLLETSDDHQVQKQASTRKEEEDASNSTDDTEAELVTAEPLESVAPESNNQDKRREVQTEPLEEGFDGSPSCQADEEKRNSLETEAARNSTETVVSDAKIEEEKIPDDSLEKETTFLENLVGSSLNDDRHETIPKDEVENGFDSKSSEEVHTEMNNLSRNGSSKSAQEAFSLGTSSNTFEEAPQPLDTPELLTEDKEAVEIISQNEEIKMIPEAIQFPEQAGIELKTHQVNSSQHDLMMFGSDTENGKEITVHSSCNSIMDKMKEISKGSGELTEMTTTMETFPTELTVKGDNHEEETEQTEEKVIKPIEEKKEILKAFSTNGTVSTAGNEAEDITAELRKSPSFDFDLSLEARSEESDQTPLLHHDKTRTRSLSILDGSSFGNPMQNQAVSVEEKTIEVERSDLDKSRAPFLNFLKEDRKEVDEKKGVEDSWTGKSKEVALTKGKRKPRPNLFSTCICCAAAIN